MIHSVIFSSNLQLDSSYYLMNDDQSSLNQNIKKKSKHPTDRTADCPARGNNDFRRKSVDSIASDVTDVERSVPPLPVTGLRRTSVTSILHKVSDHS